MLHTKLGPAESQGGRWTFTPGAGPAPGLTRATAALSRAPVTSTLKGRSGLTAATAHVRRHLGLPPSPQPTIAHRDAQSICGEAAGTGLAPTRGTDKTFHSPDFYFFSNAFFFFSSQIKGSRDERGPDRRAGGRPGRGTPRPHPPAHPPGAGRARPVPPHRLTAPAASHRPAARPARARGGGAGGPALSRRRRRRPPLPRSFRLARSSSCFSSSELFILPRRRPAAAPLRLT